MNKTIIHKETYESPLCKEYLLATKNSILGTSPDAYNPGGTIESSDGERE